MYLYQFFHTKDGLPVKIEIAEIIGAMLQDNLITQKQAYDIAGECIDAYTDGKTIKQIQDGLNRMRQALQAERTGNR